jgi:hypothetical protein
VNSCRAKGIDNYVAYVGTGSPRFYLPLDQQLPQASFAQFVVLASSLDDRDEIRKSLDTQIKQLLPQVVLVCLCWKMVHQSVIHCNIVCLVKILI